MVRVLIVDDSEQTRQTLRVLLEEFCCVVDEARHGAEALDQAQRTRPDMIISDVLMPVMDGYTLLRHLKADERLRQISFIVYTEMFVRAEDEQLALSLGADAFVIKPAEPETMIAIVRRVVADPAAFQSDSFQQQDTAWQRNMEDQLQARAMQFRSRVARLRMFFELTPECLKLLDADGALLEMNPAGLAMIEADSFEQVANQSVNPFVVPEHRTAFEDLTRRVFRGEPGTLEFEIIGLKGTRMWLETHAAPLHDDHGFVVALLAITRNITERKRAEQQLRTSEDRFASIFRASLIGIAITTIDEGVFLDVNESMLNILGRTRRNVLGRSSLELDTWPDHGDRRKMVEALKENGSISSFEGKFRRVDGSIGDSLRSFERITVDGQDCILTLVLDTTARKRAEQDLQESHERRQAILDGMFTFVGLISLDGKLLEVNRAPLEAYGLRRDDVIGMNLAEIVWFKDSPIAQYELQQALRTAANGETVRYDTKIRDAKNRVRTADFMLGPLRDAEGAIVQIIGSAVDITNRKMAETLVTIQQHVLEKIALAMPLEESLSELLCLLESHTPDMLCSILLLDADGVHLRHGAAPSLPEEYTRAIDGLVIGPQIGSCGTAAFRKEEIVVEDIATDPLWAGFRELALQHGLRACWSTPIFDADKCVIGTFAVYYRQPGLPTARHRHAISIATDIAAIAIGKDRAEAALRRNEERLRLATNGSNIGLWDWNLLTNEVHFSTIWKRQIGYEDHEIPNEFEEWRKRVHPDDLEEVLSTVAAFQKKPWPHYGIEFRFQHKNGSYRWIYATAALFKDPGGVPCRMVGSHIDVTKRRQLEDDYRDSLERLKMLSARLIATQEDERRHLARELHDEIGQSLTGIRLNLKGMQLPLGSNNLSLAQHAVTIVDATLEQVRNLALNLRPSMLDDIGLVPALRWLLHRQSQISGFTPQFLTDDFFLGGSKDTETACFRVAQESLTNIARHAKARNVSVELQASHSEWVLRVIDDGIGFDISDFDVRSMYGLHLGLAGMRERVELIGGQFEITSSATSGTVVCARFPIQSNPIQSNPIQSNPIQSNPDSDSDSDSDGFRKQ